ncbi:hypothetical protein ACJ73_00094 [Blastomyces percursus]|uniref:Major facilitator superfamily (MFS) profile domain-containing protein n=1 Tax=Blastomyces percursus TaxID=1658174 RepID=A0A1J9RIZ2_9EURO|nr:hypothetical protein ACJ73_00094 [Blastomyces percursus]
MTEVADYAMAQNVSRADGHRLSDQTRNSSLHAQNTTIDGVIDPALSSGERDGGLILTAVDMNIVATAVPSITDHFHTVADVGWYSSSFRLCVCAFQFLGKAYTLFSVKRLFLLANVISILGSLISGATTTSMMLVVGGR